MRVLLLIVSLLAAVDASQRRAIVPKISNGHWVDTWASMPQLTEPGNLPPPPFNSTNGVFFNSTIRQTVKASIGGDQIRIRLSNVFGGSDLSVSSVTVALPFNGSAGVSAVKKNTLQTLTFSGSKGIVIPNGALVVSDPINFSVKSQSILSISVFLANGQSGSSITSHPGSRVTTWFSYGDYTNAENLTDSSTLSVAHWYFLSAVEVWAPKTARAFAIVGDSITDGRGSDTDKNNRWPDQLLARMQNSFSTSQIAIINQAAGGNRILADGLGPNALGRIDRDVLAHSGVQYAMIYEGVNDIGTTDTTVAAQSAITERLIFAFKQIITRVHTAGIPIFAATIPPFGSPWNSTVIQAYDDPTRDASRRALNQWIRTSGAFDAVIDFDAVLRDSKNSSKMIAEYNSGDGLHPNVAGYQAIAAAFPLSLFSKFASGVDTFQ